MLLLAATPISNKRSQSKNDLTNTTFLFYKYITRQDLSLFASCSRDEQTYAIK